MLSGLFLFIVICKLIALLDFSQMGSPQRMASTSVGHTKHESLSGHVLRRFLRYRFVSRVSSSSFNHFCHFMFYKPWSWTLAVKDSCHILVRLQSASLRHHAQIAALVSPFLLSSGYCRLHLLSEHEARTSSPAGAKIKNSWSHTFTSVRVCVAVFSTRASVKSPHLLFRPLYTRHISLKTDGIYGMSLSN
jgi:hypothetical protein